MTKGKPGLAKDIVREQNRDALNVAIIPKSKLEQIMNGLSGGPTDEPSEPSRMNEMFTNTLRGQSFRSMFVYEAGCVDAVTRGYGGHRHARLQVSLDELGLKEFGISGLFAHGNPDNKGGGVHVF